AEFIAKPQHHAFQDLAIRAVGAPLLRRLQFAIKRQDLLASGYHSVPLQDGTQSGEQSGFPINQRAVAIKADALKAGEIEHGSILWKRRKKMGEQRSPFPVSSNHVSGHGFSRAEKHSIE